MRLVPKKNTQVHCISPGFRYNLQVFCLLVWKSPGLQVTQVAIGRSVTMKCILKFNKFVYQTPGYFA